MRYRLGLSLRGFTIEKRSGLENPDSELFDSLIGAPTISGERVDVSGSLQIADVFSAVTIVTETIATLPLKVFRKVNENVVEVPDHRAAGMLGQAPNPVTPAHRFWATAAGHLLLWGNIFIEKLRDEQGLVSELWLMHPAGVTVEYNPTLRQKRFLIDDGISNPTRLPEERVLHIYGFSTDGLVGLSPIQQARQQMGIVKARERFEAEVYANQPFTSGVIEHPGKITDGGSALRKSWQAVYAGGNRRSGENRGERHNIGVLEEGAHFNQLSAPLEDMQFVESQQMGKRSIAALFKIPPAYLGGSIGDSLTYQTVESNQIQLARMAISPVTVNMQKFLHFDRGIFPFSSWYPEFVLEALLRGDSKARGEFYKLLSDVKAIVPNEIRGLENMSPLPGGDSIPEPVMPPALAPADEEVPSD